MNAHQRRVAERARDIDRFKAVRAPHPEGDFIAIGTKFSGILAPQSELEALHKRNSEFAERLKVKGASNYSVRIEDFETGLDIAPPNCGKDECNVCHPSNLVGKRVENKRTGTTALVLEYLKANDSVGVGEPQVAINSFYVKRNDNRRVLWACVDCQEVEPGRY
jgi:hypothetical protein